MAAGKYGLKRPGRLWWVEFFGVLHCVQDDSRNLRRQMQMQWQVRGWAGMESGGEADFSAALLT